MNGERLIELGNGLELWKAAPSDIREQDKNARAMTPKMFERLETTIKRDGRLESLPFCATTPRGLEVISGHHRIRAATAAQLSAIYVVVDVSGLNQSQLESFIVEEEAPKIDIDSIEVSMEFQTVVLTFVPPAVEKIHEAVDYIKELPSHDEAWIAAMTDRAKMEAAINKICKDYDIRVVSDAIGKMAELALEACGKEQEEREAVHLKDLFGTVWVPKDTANEIRSLIKKLTGRKMIKSKHDALAALIAGFNLPSE